MHAPAVGIPWLLVCVSSFSYNFAIVLVAFMRQAAIPGDNANCLVDTTGESQYDPTKCPLAGAMYVPYWLKS